MCFKVVKVTSKDFRNFLTPSAIDKQRGLFIQPVPTYFCASEMLIAQFLIWKTAFVKGTPGLQQMKHYWYATTGSTCIISVESQYCEQNCCFEEGNYVICEGHTMNLLMSNFPKIDTSK